MCCRLEKCCCCFGIDVLSGAVVVGTAQAIISGIIVIVGLAGLISGNADLTAGFSFGIALQLLTIASAAVLIDGVK